MLLHELRSEPVFDMSDDERWIAVQKIVDSSLFRKSQRLSHLLLYLAEQTLSERTDFLTEHQIANNVFDRDGDFDPGVDTIVRSHMVRLRQKLEQYSDENHEGSRIKVSVPKGEYLVRFELAAPMLQTGAPFHPPPPAIDDEPRKWARFFIYLSCLLGAIVLVLLTLLFTVWHRTRSQTAVLQTPPSHPLWNYFFQPGRTTTFVAADSGLVLFHRMTAKDTTLAEYLKRDFSRETQGLSVERTDEVLNMANRRYTSFVDLNMYRRVEQLPFTLSGKLVVKYARDIQMDDLKQGNVILSGSRGANPWLELYETDMNFIGSADPMHHSFSFINRHPQPGEPTQFSVTESDPKQRVLGILAFLSNLDGSGNALIVEGNSMAGTEAISDFLFDDDALLPFLHKVTRANGSLSHFEVLIESTSVNGSAGPFHILAYRTHP